MHVFNKAQTNCTLKNSAPKQNSIWGLTYLYLSFFLSFYREHKHQMNYEC